MLQSLVKKLENKSALIGIVGLGYVGLPLLLRYVEAGYKVVGFDIDSEKIRKLHNGETYIKHISAEAIIKAQNGFVATTDFSRANEVDALILCVPTPLDNHREPDLSFILDTIDNMIPYLRKGQIVSLESTTYPGTTDEVLLPRIESVGLKVGKDIALIFSPEREDPGNAHYITQTIPKVVGGVTQICLEIGLKLYGHIIDKTVPVSSTRVAEMTKLLENIHRSVNIGLVNEMKIIADRMGIDIHEVIRAASTKPFGFVPYYPGPVLGGHCIPIDPFYLSWKSREYGVNARFIELAREINSSMPRWVVDKVVSALNNFRKSVKGSKILILGIAYKKNIDDIRQSPAVELMRLLQDMEAEIAYSDPHLPVFPKVHECHFNLSSIDLGPETLPKYDCVVLVTNHDVFDYDLIKCYSQLIVDTRGVYDALSSNIVKA